MRLYQENDLVVLAANPYHLGIVRANQTSSRDSVLVEWLAGEAWARPDEIVLESTHHAFHPEQRSYDIFEPIYEEQSLWTA